MIILCGPAHAELTVKKSRFTAEVFPVHSQAQARALIKAQKQKYADASHVVHAFILGSAAQIAGMSDDGEPPGTAGRPVLDVLKGSGCTDILLTVARRFGGILLGTGGLVKAYGDAAKAVLAVSHTEARIERVPFELNLSYEVYEQCRRMFKKFNVVQLNECFTERVSVNGLVETRLKAEFEKEAAGYIGAEKRLP